LGALIFLYRLALLDLEDEAAAQRTLFYIALFPTAFFFSAVYSESTFLLFSVACFYFARRRLWLWCGLAGLFVSATRIVGVLMYAIALLEWLSSTGWSLSRIHRRENWLRLLQGDKQWLGLLWIQLIPLGLLAYMLFLYQRFGDPLAFFKAQAVWGRGELLFPFSALWRDFRAIWMQNFIAGDSYMWRVTIDALTGVFALVGSVIAWRRLGESYGLYTFLSVLIPGLTNSTFSMSRFVLVMFPLYMLLAIWGRNQVVDKIITIGFTLLLAILTTLFVNWSFVA
jgi:hypothetical protein